MVKWGIVLVLIAILASGAYQLLRNTKEADGQAAALNDKVSALQKENNQLNDQLKYLADPANLLKEVKSRFNYREAGEKIIIIVPKEAN